MTGQHRLKIASTGGRLPGPASTESLQTAGIVDVADVHPRQCWPQLGRTALARVTVPVPARSCKFADVEAEPRSQRTVHAVPLKSVCGATGRLHTPSR